MLVVAALAVVVSLPELAQAQQTGLFPNAPIRRQRPLKEQEDPVYEIYKQQYFGYHPTCWRRFPNGWGCPSPEAPDRARSLKDHPFGKAPEQGEEEMLPPGDTGRGQPDGAAVPKPRVPTERDPFEDATPPPPRNPNGPRTRTQPTAPPTDDRSPFENVPDAGKPAAPPGAANAGTPNRGVSYRGQTEPMGNDQESQPVADEAPLLAMPNLNSSTDADGGSTLDAVDTTLPANSGVNGNGAAVPVANSPRRSLIGSFFSNLGMNWTRR